MLLGQGLFFSGCPSLALPRSEEPNPQKPLLGQRGGLVPGVSAFSLWGQAGGAAREGNFLSGEEPGDRNLMRPVQ